MSMIWLSLLGLHISLKTDILDTITVLKFLAMTVTTTHESRRVVMNVSGEIYKTSQETLTRFLNALLGNDTKRKGKSSAGLIKCTSLTEVTSASIDLVFLSIGRLVSLPFGYLAGRLLWRNASSFNCQLWTSRTWRWNEGVVINEDDEEENDNDLRWCFEKQFSKHHLEVPAETRIVESFQYLYVDSFLVSVHPCCLHRDDWRFEDGQMESFRFDPEHLVFVILSQQEDFLQGDDGWLFSCSYFVYQSFSYLVQAGWITCRRRR